MHIGPIASGSAVVADESVLPAILEQQRQLIGLEMEAYGLMAAAHAASPKPIAFVLKSVCDFASAKKDDRFQAYAAYTSANALRVFLEKYIDEIIDMTGE
jgi:nucleoside phosphorylase